MKKKKKMQLSSHKVHLYWPQKIQIQSKCKTHRMIKMHNEDNRSIPLPFPHIPPLLFYREKKKNVFSLISFLSQTLCFMYPPEAHPLKAEWKCLQMVERDMGGHHPWANTIFPGSGDLKRRNSSPQNPSHSFSEELKVNLRGKEWRQNMAKDSGYRKGLDR